MCICAICLENYVNPSVVLMVNNIVNYICETSPHPRAGKCSRFSPRTAKDAPVHTWTYTRYTPRSPPRSDEPPADIPLIIGVIFYVLLGNKPALRRSRSDNTRVRIHPRRPADSITTGNPLSGSVTTDVVPESNEAMSLSHHEETRLPRSTIPGSRRDRPSDDPE